jgi:lipopolysaccharide transport system permease protein
MTRPPGGPLVAASATPRAALAALVRNRELLGELVKRDFLGRYKGSLLGVLWSLFHPLLMLTVYTIVFSVAFKARWGGAQDSKVSFAIVLFSGMIVHAFFAECLNRAPDLITARPNYVKKVVFPLEVLPWMALCSALLHLLVSLGVLLLFCLIGGVTIQPTAVLVPVVLLPLVLQTIGVVNMLAALGVYLRDLSQGMAMVTTVALFLSPVFYPIDSLPAGYRLLVSCNPITLPIVQVRDLMLWGRPVDWSLWGLSLGIGLLVAYAGYWWFQKTRRGFADVI